jgi:hypothetical protein
VAASRYSNEEAFVAHLLTTTGTRPYDLERDFRAFANNLEIHFRLVKARASQQEFRRIVLEHQGERCAVCDIAIAAVVDAAHVIPKQHQGTDDHRNGLVLCALHHRMFDADMFRILPEGYAVQPMTGFTLADLRITRIDIGHLESKPHHDALRWRWDRPRRN